MAQNLSLDSNPCKTWKIDLSAPPTIAQCGIGIHGHERHESYLLPELWSLHVYRYEADIVIDGLRYVIRPGYASLVAPGTPIAYDFKGRSVHLYAHFRVGRVAFTENNELSEVSVMQDLGLRFAMINEQMESLSTPQGSRYRAQATLWSILWQLSESSRKSDDHGDGHPAVRSAVKQIELGLAEELSVADLARSVGVSYSYLGRLFQTEFGTTVVGYIRERRMSRANHLLRQSTLPIKTVAASVGIPDLHLFNKSIRRATGYSPRALREL